jgi:hypothetical protein
MMCGIAIEGLQFPFLANLREDGGIGKDRRFWRLLFFHPGYSAAAQILPAVQQF